jgi:hypothetical protein
MRVALLLFLLCVTRALAQSGVTVNDQARFVAGLPVSSAGLEPLTHSQVWQSHAAQLDQAWSKSEQRQVLSARAWARINVPGSQSGAPVYYMFSGPDFIYANAFFPNSSTYILCGTEPIGSIPDLTKMSADHIANSLLLLRGSMSTILRFHYFITKEMRQDLTHGEFGGTLPILYVFLARSGKTVRAVSNVSSPAPGVRIDFSSGIGRSQTLYYFKVDLSNGKGSGGFLSWCAGHGQGFGLLKSASYLPHSDSFSGVRNFLLGSCKVIVEDDSGIPFRYFDSKRWTVRLFGNFTAPIELFAKNQQPDLVQAYANSHPAPLGFAFGYDYKRANGMAIVAVKK